MLAILLAYLRFIYEILLAVYRDFLGTMLLIRTRRRLTKFHHEDTNVFREFEKLVRTQPGKACIVYGEHIWTFKDMEIYANKIACLFQKRYGLKKGDCVALFMENKPEYVGVWLGLSKIGVITALVNTNLKNEALLHSITIANASAVVFGSTLEDSMMTIVDKLNKDVHLLIEGEKATKSNAVSLEESLEKQEFEIVQSNEPVLANDIILYIYTSGTTGLPKPAVIRQSRYYGGGFSFFDAAGLTPSDVVMIALPIYHGNGGLLGIGAAIVSGATVVLRKKFSASAFWRECIQFKCTSFVYVGEICRFLVNQPKSEFDRAHNIRVAFGNGLRANVWKEFNERFGVQCMEFYAASEGNCNMVNIVRKVGACGFFPLIHKLFTVPAFPVFIIRIDQYMNPIRDENGFCIQCQPGEKGLLVGIIGNNPVTAYNGYANNQKASQTKVIENVFKKGQRAFNSGDLMMQDSLGYVYFCDRLGDTFRWRGENVATIEVENAISRRLNSREVVVYGVEVPGQEGRAGMAALSCEPEHIDMVELVDKLKIDLPAYARPVFLRFVKTLEHTGTFKATKLKFVEESYNVKVVQDKIYYFDLKESSYKILTENIYENILNGNIRL